MTDALVLSIAILGLRLSVMGAARFEVEIREAGSDQVVRRDWSPAELEQSIAWLKRMKGSSQKTEKIVR